MAPLPTTSMQADRLVYGQLMDEGGGYLRHKIAVTDVTYGGDDSRYANAFANARFALADSLAIAGYRADGQERAPYKLSAVIKDVQWPRCFFGSCESGATISYTLYDNQEKPVYQDMLVVPYTHEYSIFGGDMPMVQREVLGGAIGENYAQLLHVLSRMKKPDVKD